MGDMAMVPATVSEDPVEGKRGFALASWELEPVFEMYWCEGRKGWHILPLKYIE